MSSQYKRSGFCGSGEAVNDYDTPILDNFFELQGVLNVAIKKQMQHNVDTKRYQPISEVERAINKDLLGKVGVTIVSSNVHCILKKGILKKR